VVPSEDIQAVPSDSHHPPSLGSVGRPVDPNPWPPPALSTPPNHPHHTAATVAPYHRVVQGTARPPMVARESRATIKPM